MRHFILACPVATRPLRMFVTSTTARLVAPARRMQRPAARVWRTIGAVDMAPIAIAADERLGTTTWVSAQEQPGLRSVIMVVPAALVMRPPMAWTRAAVTAMMPLQSCLCAVGHGAEAKLPGDGSAPCLPSNPGRSTASPSNIPRPDPRLEGHPGLSRWVHRNLPPLRFAARQGRSASGRVPPMDYPDNPERRSVGRPSGDASANSYGFVAAATGSAGQCSPRWRPSQHASR
jgi:hypothetical protein